jgi:hypothetical protein
MPHGDDAAGIAEWRLHGAAWFGSAGTQRET